MYSLVLLFLQQSAPSSLVVFSSLTCSVVCQVLNISGSNITGALPLTWGSPGALPALVELELGHNSITGQAVTISLHQ